MNIVDTRNGRRDITLTIEERKRKKTIFHYETAKKQARLRAKRKVISG